MTKREADDGRPAASLDQSSYKVVYPGDIIMNALGKPHGSIGASTELGITSPAYWVLKVDPQQGEPRFFHYLLRSDHAINEYKRLGKYLPPNQFDLSWELFRNIEFPLPPIEEQRRIAEFLDDQVGRIDQAIELRNEQVAFLEETLNSSRAALFAKFGESANSRTLSNLSVTGAVVLGRGNVISKEDIAETPGDYPVYSSARENDGEIGKYGLYMFDEELVTWSVDGGGRVFYRPRGKFSVTNICAYCRVMDKGLLRADYMGLAMQEAHSHFKFDWQDKAHPGVVRGLYQVPMLSLEDQAVVVAEWQVESDQASVRTNQINAGVDLLKERKRSLITAAVTGQLDVTAARPITGPLVSNTLCTSVEQSAKATGVAL
jgi:type I restriction enzyme S subunit